MLRFTERVSVPVLSVLVVVACVVTGFSQKSKPSACPSYQVPTTDSKCYLGSGCLDTSFGTLGIVLAPIGGLQVYGIDKAFTKSDGKVILVGYGSNYGATGRDLLVARLNADGSVDTTFGEVDVANPYQRTGYALADIGSTNDTGTAGALLSDGSILAAGYDIANYQNAVVRFTQDGLIDTAFGTGGKVMIPLDKLWLHDMAVQQDGKIVVAGGEPYFTAVRLNASGSYDTSFGSGGTAFTRVLGGSYNQSYAVVLQPTASGERVVVGGFGTKKPNGVAAFGLTAFKQDGTVDLSFGSHGYAVNEFSEGAAVIFDLAVDASNKIVAAGRVTTSCAGLDLAFARYTASGSLDATFSGDGKLTQNVYGGSDIANSVAIQSNGKIVASGSARTTESDINNADFMVLRLNSNGSLDTSFGPGLSGFHGPGIVTTDIVGPAFSLGWALGIQSDGKLLLAGPANYGGTNFAVARYLP